MRRTILFIFSFCIFLSFCEQESQAFGLFNIFKHPTIGRYVGKVKNALPEEEIIKYAKQIEKAGDWEIVKQILGKMKLSDEVLEDTFMRIAIYNKKIPQKEADEMFRTLKGTSGFRQTLSKICGVNDAKDKGHLFELRISRTGKDNGFDILEIGKRFNDNIKKGESDIDVILKKKQKLFAMECKDYSSSTNININDYLDDMNTLREFNKQNLGTIPVFVCKNIPDNQNTIMKLKDAAKLRNIELLFGSEDEIMTQLDLLIDFY